MALDYFATQAGTYSAEVTRRAVFAWAARTGANSPGIIAGGLLSASDLQITAPASGMTVNIGVGEALVGGSEGGSQGGYTVRNSATYSATVAAANSTNPRVDAVVVTMADALYTQPSDVGSTTNGPVFAVVTGTPTAGATLANLSGAPAIPLSSLLRGYVLVPAGSSNVTAGNISNVATVVQTGAPVLMPTGTKTSAYTARPGDLVEASGTFTVTSPAAAKGLQWGVTSIGTGTVTVTAASGVFYGPGLGSGGAASFTISQAGVGVTITSDGTNWLVSGLGTGFPAHNSTSGYYSSPTAFGGGSGPKSDSIPHGLGVAPSGVSVVAATITTTGGTYPVLVSVSGVDATNINVVSTIPTGGTASVGPNFYWLAWV